MTDIENVILSRITYVRVFSDGNYNVKVSVLDGELLIDDGVTSEIYRTDSDIHIIHLAVVYDDGIKLCITYSTNRDIRAEILRKTQEYGWFSVSPGTDGICQ